jgi:hypothetical protein
MGEIQKGKIDVDKLDSLSGGVLFNANGISGADPNNLWEVLDDKDGHVVARFPSEAAARAALGALNENHVELNWDQVLALRGQA